MKTERCKENGKIYQKLSMKPTQKRQSCICDCTYAALSFLCWLHT